MIIDENKTVSHGSGMGQTKNFTANLDGMMFDNMINGIYSDKIAAPIRELSTNARDGHAAVNALDKPFDMHLPTRFSPEFYVRDYGCSLTHDEVMDMYSVLGMSTKRETNDQTGCLGLGSKSPFAYTTTFSVTCWLDGRERVYACYKQSGGTPAISLVHDISSNKATGVKVGFAVDATDIEGFNRTAEKVLIGFDVPPNIINSVNTFKINDDKPMIETKTVKLFETETFERPQSYVIQGSVAYPLEIKSALKNAIQTHPDTEKSTKYPYNCPEEELLKNCSIHLTLPIGSVNTTTSREELSYDNKTCEAIANELVKFITDQRKDMESKYEKQANKFQAQKLFSEDQNSDVITKLQTICNMEVKPKFKGETLYHSFRLVNWDDKLVLKGCNTKGYIGISQQPNVAEVKGTVTYLDAVNSKVRLGVMKGSFSFKSGQDHSNTIPFVELSQDVKWYVRIIDRDTYKSINNRLRTMWMECSRNENSLYVEVNNISDWDKLRKVLMIKKGNIKYLEDMADTKMPSTTVVTAAGGTKVVNTKVDLKQIVPQRYASNADNKRITIDLSDNTKYIRVWQKGTQYYFDNPNIVGMITENMDQSTVSRHIKNAIEDTTWDLSYDVVCLNQQNKGLNKDYPNKFLNFNDEYKKHLKTKLSVIPKMLSKSNMQDSIGKDSDFYHMFEYFNLTDQKDLPNFLDVITKRLTLKKDLNGNTTSINRNLIREVEEHFPDEVRKLREQMVGGGIKLIDVDQVKKDYPILETIFYSYQEMTRYSYQNRDQEKAVIKAALTQYCELLKKMGK